jgi:hypothetical protein
VRRRGPWRSRLRRLGLGLSGCAGVLDGVAAEQQADRDVVPCGQVHDGLRYPVGVGGVGLHDLWGLVPDHADEGADRLLVGVADRPDGHGGPGPVGAHATRFQHGDHVERGDLLGENRGEAAHGPLGALVTGEAHRADPATE